jgi:hypothetical protein
MLNNKIHTNMKKSIYIIMLLTSVYTFSRCSEEAYEEKYADPNKVSEVSLDKLMPGTFLHANNFAMSGYSRYFGYEPQCLGKQSNSLGFTLEDGFYYKWESDGWGEPPYGDLMKGIASFRVMELVYNGMDEGDKAANELFMLAANIHLLAHALYILDFYGDIPFDEVGRIALTQDVADSHPHYQKASELYDRILDQLGDINTRLAQAQKPPTFSAQDFINKGDVEQWRRYANSLRLRAALRVSTQGELSSKGQSVIAEILGGGSSSYPLVENNAQNIQVARQESGPLNVEGGSGFDWHNLQTASTELIVKMQKAGDGGVYVDGQDDPRLPILFCLATKNGELPVATPAEEEVKEPLETGKAVATVFRGVCASTDYDTFQKMFFTRTTRAYYSRVRMNGFFWRNQKWDHQIISAAEIWFIKAEAYQRGWATGDAKAAFKEAIKQSIRFYFKYHSTEHRNRTEADNTDSDYLNGIQQRTVINPAEPSDAWIDQFADDRWNAQINGSAYSGGTLEAILTQKWVNFSYLFCGEQWSDLRRTGYPRMKYNPDHNAGAEALNPANRLRYPSSERSFNRNFSSEVGSLDNFTSVMFWAKENWHD